MKSLGQLSERRVWSLYCLMFCLLTRVSGFGQENASWTSLLQEGLFEEEANRDYQTALEKYQQIVSASQEQRRIARCPRSGERG